MQKASPRPEEARCLEVLDLYGVLDTPPEPALDDLAALAAEVCDAPIALVTLLDSKRQWFKARVGLAVTHTARDVAFCSHAVLQDDVLIVTDAAADPRFADNPLVTGDPGIRFYAGLPLRSREGLALGTLCVIDRSPRTLTAAQQRALRVLNRHVMAELELRRANRELEARVRERERDLARANIALHGAAAERAAARLALVESDLDLRLTLEAAHIGLWQVDVATGKSTFSERTREIFGLRPGVLSATREQLPAAIHPQDRARVQAALAHAVATGADYTIEHRILRPDGSVRWMLAKGRLHDGVAGGALQLRGVAIDITAEKRAAEEQRQMYERVSDAFVALDRDWRYTFVNAKAGELFGRHPEELVGRHIWTEFPEGVGQPFQLAYERALRTQQAEVLEAYYAPWDRWFENRIFPSPEGVSIYFHEITDRKRAEAAAREHEQEMRLALDAAGAGVWVLDLATGRTALDERLCEIFGLPPETRSISNAAILEALHPDDRARTEVALREALLGRKDYDIVQRIIRPGGELRWTAVKGRAEYGPDGRAMRVRGVTTDITGRKSIEMAARQHEARLSNVFQQASDGIYVLDAAHRYLDVNARGCELLGYSRGELLKMGVADVLAPEEAARLPDALARMMAGVPHLGEWRHVRKDGSAFPGEVSARRLDEHSYIAVVRDLTERRRTESALRESERNKTALIAHLPGAVYRCRNDATWSTEYVSEAVEGLTGHPPRAFLDGTVSFGGLIHAADRARVWETVQRAAERHESYTMDYRIVRADGQERHVWEQGSGVRDAGGTLVALEGFIQDVTERHRAEAALRESQQRLLDLIDGLGPQIFVGLLSPDGRLLEANRSALAAAGVERAAVLGTPVDESVWIAHSPRVQQEFREAVAAAGGGAMVRFDTQLSVAGGALAWVDFTLQPLRDASGAIHYLVASASVITERRRAEDELRAAADRLQALSRRLVETQEVAQRRLSTELHDRIGQNLTALAVNLNIMEGLLAADPDPKLVRRLRDSKTLLRDTTTSARELITELRPVALDDYGVLAGLRGYGEQFEQRTGIAVRVTGEEPVSRLPRAAEMALYRIAQEALTNVAKHAGARHVAVELCATDDGAELEIQDDGAGFDPAQVGDDGRAHWGLAMMRERAEAVGATLAVDSAPGRGTRVTISVKVRP